jgi:hypothetical protein
MNGCQANSTTRATTSEGNCTRPKVGVGLTRGCASSGSIGISSIGSCFEASCGGISGSGAPSARRCAGGREAVVIREGRTVTPGEAVGGRGDGDSVAVVLVDLDFCQHALCAEVYVGEMFSAARRGAARIRTRQPYVASPPISNNVSSDDS